VSEVGGRETEIALLDRDFASWASSLLPAQLNALRAYQEGAYRLINGVLRGRIDRSSLSRRENELVLTVRAALDDAIDAGTMVRPCRVYRGIRDVQRVFGVDSPDALLSEDFVLAGYVSTSIRRLVAERFGRGSQGAVLELLVPAGANAAWLPIVGGEDYRDQAELLLPHLTRISVTAAGQDERGILMLAGKVVL
jgi:hypothetical protein